MARTILITGNFPLYDRDGIPTGKTEFVVSHGINEDTGQNVVLPNDPPITFPRSYFDNDLNEWVLPGEEI